ncbi:hypothetical protein MNBD_GAMMA11-2824 [hydrothermal vent metagenome]|uniref:Uncharacterized protein n=1 Tax=hydrothermal vent metagenome TaxID=652676 RepID=A0A3B0WSA4_9ZZZZ
MNVVSQLVELLARLYSETEGYIDNPADAQLWYNRGYANGIAAFLVAQGLSEKLSHLALDEADIHQKDGVMEWFKAYHHGFEMGRHESAEVYGH